MKAAGLVPGSFLSVLMAFGVAGAVAANRPPNERDLTGDDGKRRVVLLMRVVAEVDGKLVPPFRHPSAVDNVTFGVGDFETGTRVRLTGARFLSDATRDEGWVFLLVKPGSQYLAIREPRSSDAVSYDARLQTCPRWWVEIPTESRVHYAGTFSLPGRGRGMIWGPRQMVEFDESRVEVRDESVRAAEICRQLLPSLAPVSIQMAERHRPGDTIIIETPDGR